MFMVDKLLLFLTQIIDLNNSRCLDYGDRSSFEDLCPQIRR